MQFLFLLWILLIPNFSLGQTPVAGVGAPPSCAVFFPRAPVFCGKLLIPDAAGHRILAVEANGGCSVFAGTGARGYSGDGGLATLAQFNSPQSLHCDPLTNDVLVADSQNWAIRKITPSGIISTIFRDSINSYLFSARTQPDNSLLISSLTSQSNIRRLILGNPSPFAGINAGFGFSGDGGPAISARLNSPTDTLLLPNGDTLIADYNNNRIRGVNPAGLIYTFLGNGAASSIDGPIFTATTYRPYSLTRDTFTGDIYIAQNILDSFPGSGAVRRVSPSGSVSTFYRIPSAHATGVYASATKLYVSSGQNSSAQVVSFPLPNAPTPVPTPTPNPSLPACIITNSPCNLSIP